MLQDLLIALGYGLCHQLPERTQHAGGLQLPVCARDTGIYLGFMLGFLLLVALNRRSRPREMPTPPVLVLLGVFVAAMAIDGVTSYAGLRETTNAIRLATGLMTGWALAPITMAMVNDQLWARSNRRRVLEGRRSTVLWLAGLPVTFALSWWVLPALGVSYALVSAVSIIVTFTAVNLVIVALVPRLERRAHRMRDAVPQVLLAAALTASELGVAAWLRVMAEGLR